MSILQQFSKITTILGLSALMLSGLGIFSGGVKAEANTGFRLPYTAGTSLRTTQSCIDEIDGANCTHSGDSVQKFSVDFGCGVQNPNILAIASGKVVESGYFGVYGEYVKIEHSGGFQSLYAHLQSGTRITLNTQVIRGQKIGNCGTTGNSTGNHLHLELRNPDQAKIEGKNLKQTYRIRFEEIPTNGGQAREPKFIYLQKLSSFSNK